MKKENQSENKSEICHQEVVERIKKSREEYMAVKVPEEGLLRMKEAIQQAKHQKMQERRKRRWKIGAGLAAAAAIVLLIPNCSEAYAQALMKLPVVGRFFEVITIRDYQFDDGYSMADVKVPKLEDNSLEEPDEKNSAIEDINRSVEEYTNEILERFEENQEILEGQGHQSLNISYEVLTDTDDWFTLELNVAEVQGSGFEYRRYYHINKSTGKIAGLKELFKEGSSYLAIISSYIEKEMERYNKESEDGPVYWIGENDFYGEGFQGIDDQQNFYLDQDGSLVIIFDEYEVAPGYMGMPSFKIPKELIEDIRRF